MSEKKEIKEENIKKVNGGGFDLNITKDVGNVMYTNLPHGSTDDNIHAPHDVGHGTIPNNSLEDVNGGIRIRGCEGDDPLPGETKKGGAVYNQDPLNSNTNKNSN